MRSLILYLAIFALGTSLKVQSQPYSGQTFYAHGGINATLTSGTHVSTYPGFIMAGYASTLNAPGNPNFLVDKVDVNGQFSSPGHFSNKYSVFDNAPTCGNNINKEANCYGVSVIEYHSGQAVYALVAALSGAVFFTTLDNSGLSIHNALYLLPNGAVPDCKPLITTSAAGDYYICGSYNLNTSDFMYVLKVNSSGSNLWSKTYTRSAAGCTLVPKGMVEDSYAGFPELAIAGTEGEQNTTDGFLITLNGATGALVMQNAYASGSSVNESLSSIALVPGNGGYMIGGNTDISNTGHSWMMKLNSSGGIKWSTCIIPSTNQAARDVIAVQERAGGTKECYGLTLSNGTGGGMLVLKVDSSGNAFSQTGNTNNEFRYNNNNQPALSGAMSMLDMPAANPNTGIHVFGTDLGSVSQFFLNQSDFNGLTTNCPSPNYQYETIITHTVPGPSVVYSINLVSAASLTACTLYSLSVIPYTYSPSQDHYSVYTGIDQISNKITLGLSIYPNPVKDVATLRYTSRDGGNVNILLTDVFGRKIGQLDAGYKNSGENMLYLDMKDLNLQTGVYIVSITLNGTTDHQRIIYNRD